MTAPKNGHRARNSSSQFEEIDPRTFEYWLSDNRNKVRLRRIELIEAATLLFYAKRFGDGLKEACR